jgi:hypothetical protein
MEGWEEGENKEVKETSFLFFVNKQKTKQTNKSFKNINREK